MGLVYVPIELEGLNNIDTTIKHLEGIKDTHRLNVSEEMVMIDVIGIIKAIKKEVE